MTRAKTAGTWQTSTRYGIDSVVDNNGSEFWVFIDLGREPNAFYITPLSGLEMTFIRHIWIIWINMADTVLKTMNQLITPYQ